MLEQSIESAKGNFGVQKVKRLVYKYHLRTRLPDQDYFCITV